MRQIDKARRRIKSPRGLSTVNLIADRPRPPMGRRRGIVQPGARHAHGRKTKTGARPKMREAGQSQARQHDGRKCGAMRRRACQRRCEATRGLRRREGDERRATRQRRETTVYTTAAGGRVTGVAGRAPDADHSRPVILDAGHWHLARQHRVAGGAAPHAGLCAAARLAAATLIQVAPAACWLQGNIREDTCPMDHDCSAADIAPETLVDRGVDESLGIVHHRDHGDLGDFALCARGNTCGRQR
jgi:hypothetical protein